MSSRHRSSKRLKYRSHVPEAGGDAPPCLLPTQDLGCLDSVKRVAAVDSVKTDDFGGRAL